jgi:hypothetical protein
MPISQDCQRETRAQETISTNPNKGEMTSGEINRAEMGSTFSPGSYLNIQPDVKKMAENCSTQNSQRSNKTNATSTHNPKQRLQVQKQDSFPEICP